MDCSPVTTDQIAKLNIMLGSLLSVNYNFSRLLSEREFNTQVKFVLEEFKEIVTNEDVILRDLFLDKKYIYCLSNFQDLNIVEKSFLYYLNQYKREVFPQTLEEILEEACFSYIKIHIGCILKFGIDYQIFTPSEYMDDGCIEMFEKFRNFRKFSQINNTVRTTI